MRRVLGVDFAERHSGAVLLNADGSVAKQFAVDLGLRDVTPAGIEKKMDRLGEWVEEMLPTARSDYLSPMSFIVAVEDVHPTAMNVKPVLRLQGAFLNILARRWIPWTLIEPKVWQPHFGYRKKEHHDSKKWAKMACAQLGFTPEETFKAREKSDICDAYLVARYIQEESHAD